MPKILKLSIRQNVPLVRITGFDRETIPVTGNETVINFTSSFNFPNLQFFDYRSQRIIAKFIPGSWLRIGFVQLSTINAANQRLVADLITIITSFMEVKLTHFKASFCQTYPISI